MDLIARVLSRCSFSPPVGAWRLVQPKFERDPLELVVRLRREIIRPLGLCGIRAARLSGPGDVSPRVLPPSHKSLKSPLSSFTASAVSPQEYPCSPYPRRAALSISISLSLTLPTGNNLLTLFPVLLTYFLLCCSAFCCTFFFFFLDFFTESHI